MTLTKANLVEALYKKHESITKTGASETVEALLRIAKENFISGNDLLLSGFGKFTVNDKNARRGRNPQTGEQMLLEPRRVISFKPSAGLRQKVNEL